MAGIAFCRARRNAGGQGFDIWLLGSKNDRPIADKIVELVAAYGQSAKPVNLCGETSLVEALDLMSLSACVVSNDSGLMHIAAAIGRPLVALFGSSSPAMTPPLAKQVRLLERTLPVGRASNGNVRSGISIA